jgi:hypothetical protein
MSGAIGFSAGLLTFAILASLALPHLETGLMFLPIFAISVLVGFATSKIYARFKK